MRDEKRHIQALLNARHSYQTRVIAWYRERNGIVEVEPGFDLFREAEKELLTF